MSEDVIKIFYSYSRKGLALRNTLTGEARVIPVILHPCDWNRPDVPFSKLNVLPTHATPVTSWKNMDEAFAIVAQRIRETVDTNSICECDRYDPPASGIPLRKARLILFELFNQCLYTHCPTQLPSPLACIPPAKESTLPFEGGAKAGLASLCRWAKVSSEQSPSLTHHAESVQ